MSEQRSVDGSLVFDTKINTESFKQDLEELKGLAEQTEVQAVVGSKIDKTGYEADKQELNREAESGIDTVTGKSDLDKSGFEADKRELDRQAETGIDTVTAPTAVDDSGLKKDISKLDDTAKKAVSQLDSPLKDGELTFDTKVSGTSAAEIAKGMLGSNLIQFGLEKAVNFGKKGIQLASDLEEVQNVVDVTFGEGAGQIEEFAKAASTSFGLTELQAKQFTGTVGAMVKSMGLTEQEALDMSTSLVGLTGDMASFYNLDHETAFEKIRSGISGETEPLKALGINMSVANLEAYRLTKGIKKAYEEMSEAEKVQLRYGYIMEQTTDAQGDFVRTQDSYANQVRVLQNNLDTMAANVGSMLVPALTKAVGWFNSLFEGPQTNKLQEEITSASEALNAVSGEIKSIKDDYTKEAIKIRVNYEEATELTETLELLKEAADKGYGERTLRLGMTGDDVAALQNQLASLGLAIQITDQVGVFGESTEAALKEYQGAMGLVADGIAGAKTYAAMNAEDTAKLVSATQQLVDIYPDLAEYVGENGVLMLEKDRVDELIASYKDLQLEKLMASRVEQIQGVYADALIEMELLKQKSKEAEMELDRLNKKQLEMVNAYQQVAQTFVAGYSSGGKRDPQAEIDAVNAYISAFGDISSALDLASESGLNISGLFGDDGAIKSLSEITQMENGLKALTELMLALYRTGSEDQFQFADDIAATQTALEAAQEAITEYEGVVENARKEAATAEAALKNFGKEVEPAGEDAGKTAGQAAADALLDQESEIDSAVREIADSAQKEANNHVIHYRSVVDSPATGTSRSYPGHATGLDRVPYDNYLARLHVGEAVLTASEAQKWRAGESKGGGVSAEQLAAAMEPVVESIRNIRIALDVDGREFASNQAAHNRTALNRYNTQIARGMGK